MSNNSYLKVSHSTAGSVRLLSPMKKSKIVSANLQNLDGWGRGGKGRCDI